MEIKEIVKGLQGVYQVVHSRGYEPGKATMCKDISTAISVLERIDEGKIATRPS